MSTVVFNINDLISSNQTLTIIEKNNKKALETFDKEGYSNNLHSWAAQSFPSAFKIYEYPISTPTDEITMYTCSDGKSRDVWSYIPFCLGYDIVTYISNLQAKFQGITLSYSITTGLTTLLYVHATKA